MRYTAWVPTRARRTIRSTVRTVGRMTSSTRMLPSFLIVGAQRCGTTSLYRALTGHPAILPAALHKGVHYFDTGYHHGPAWYRGHFPLTITAHQAAARSGTEPITGESSPYYMFHPLAPGRIAADLPGVRILVLLRDPVERAYSAHAHELARGFENEQFEKALELEPERLASESAKIAEMPGYVSHAHQHQAYLARGQYIEQLERLERLFGRDALHVIDSHELFQHPEKNYPGVLAFLGLPHVPSTVPALNARPRAPMPASVRRRLEDHFAPYDERLAAWLGRTPGWRR